MRHTAGLVPPRGGEYLKSLGRIWGEYGDISEPFRKFLWVDW